MIKGEKMVAPFPQHVKQYLERIGSRKRKCTVYTEDAGRPWVLYSYWDSGSRDQYRAWDARGVEIHLPIGGAPGFTKTPSAWTPQRGDVLVTFGTFMGKPATPSITFYK
jgi:hypothetical protein